MRHLALLPLSLVPLSLVNLALTRPLASFLEARGLFSAENLVRGHLLVSLSGLVLVTTLLIHVTSPAEYGRLLLLKGLRVAFLTLSSVLLLSLESLTEEGSPATFLTAMVLALAAVAAWLSSRHQEGEAPDRPNRLLFWLGLACAFGFASLDEILMIHESIGGSLRSHWSSVGWLQRVDLMTAVYAVAAVAFVLASYVLFKPVFERASRNFALTLLGAALLFAVAALFDSGAFLLEGLGTWTDFNLLSSAAEEAFEFLAATLFLLAGLIALLDQLEPTARNRLLRIPETPPPARGAPIGLIAAAGLYVVGVAALAIHYRLAPPSILVGGEAPEIELFAGPDEGLKGAYGVAVRDQSVYVGNDDGTTIAFDRNRNSSVSIAPVDELGKLTDLAVTGDGTILLADDHRFAVLALRPGSRAETLLTRQDGLRGARGLALGPDGLLFIADGSSSSVFRYDGPSLSHYASSLDGLVAPRDLAFDHLGNLYVTDDARNRVFRIGPDGAVVSFGGDDLLPGSIAAWAGCVFVTDRARGAVLRFDPDGRRARLATFAQRYRNLQGVAVDELGALYVVSSNTPPLPSHVFKLVTTPAMRTACGEPRAAP